MKVLMLSKAMVVGAYQRKAELMAELGGEALDLTVAVPPLWRDGALERRLERVHEAGYRLVETPIRRPGDFHLHHYPRLGTLIDELRPDLVHVDEEAYNLATFLALRAARRVGAKAVFFTWQNLQRRYPPPFAQFERWAYRRVDGAIAGSTTAAEVLRAKGYTGRLWTIPQFGVDEQRFRPPESRPDDPDRPIVVGYAGRLVEAKGVDLLLDALARIAPDGASSNWRLEIVGEGEAEAALRQQSRSLGISERVRFRPWLASSDMPDFYRSLDLLVLPSRSTPSWIEQFGRVLTEAMACGVVCVGSDSGEIPRVIGEAGRVFPEGDAEALSGRLAELIGDAALRGRLATAGRLRVLEHFTMRRVAEATLEAYAQLMADRTP